NVGIRRASSRRLAQIRCWPKVVSLEPCRREVSISGASNSFSALRKIPQACRYDKPQALQAPAICPVASTAARRRSTSLKDNSVPEGFSSTHSELKRALYLYVICLPLLL